MKERKSLKAEAIHGVRVVRSTGSKDRHSKVCTARGTRDRRVRLSPKTAILFYDVQDRLGYDRPSKAIDWLMKEAKAAIDALHHPSPSPSPTQVSKLECGTTQEHSNNPAGLGFSNQGDAPPPSMSRRSEDYQEQLLTHLELLDANSEIVGLQRSIGGEEEYSPPVSFQREPLQSSFWGINENSPEFQDFRFAGEDLCGVPTFQEDLLSESSRFLHYEEW